MARVKAPAGLGVNAKKLWDETVAEYDLTRHELVILEGACREVDLVDRLEAALDEAEMVVEGSMGQKTAHPLLSEVRQHRAATASLIKLLKLPESEGESKPANPRSSSARAAANARWGTGGA